MSVMPWSCSTAATAAINESVLFALSFVNTDRSVRSGMTPNNFTCLTWPAMTACAAPPSFKVLMALPSWPSSIHVNVVRPRSRARGSRSGDAWPLIATVTTSCPSRRAARRTRNGNVPLPAMRPIATVDRLLDVHQILEPARRPSQDDATVRGGNERHQIVHFRRAQRRVAFDQFQRAARVVLHEMPVRLPQLFDQLRRKAPARQADGVHTVNSCPVADSLRIRQRIPRDHGVAADERVFADTAELVHA